MPRRVGRDPDKVKAKHFKYNHSEKGQKRNRDYEERHKDTRGVRWEPARLGYKDM